MKLGAFLAVAVAVIVAFFFFDKDSEHWRMPAELNEISGIAYISENKLACVQDESGKIFIYNLKSYEIEREIKFAKRGDFEAVAIVNEIAYILRSDGVIFEVKNFNDNPEVSTFPTWLSKIQDAEGLCYDKKNKRLLLIFKENEEDINFKHIYSFDLNTKELNQEPVVSISLNNDKLNKKKITKRLLPSEIAINSKTNEILITDAVNHQLITIDFNGQILRATPLDPTTFPHPEGIAISEEGKIYIANDGNGKKRGGSIGLYSSSD